MEARVALALQEPGTGGGGGAVEERGEGGSEGQGWRERASEQWREGASEQWRGNDGRERGARAYGMEAQTKRQRRYDLKCSGTWFTK